MSSEGLPRAMNYTKEEYHRLIHAQICTGVLRNSGDVRWCRLGLEILRMEKEDANSKQNATEYEEAIKPLLKKVKSA